MDTPSRELREMNVVDSASQQRGRLYWFRDERRDIAEYIRDRVGVRVDSIPEGLRTELEREVVPLRSHGLTETDVRVSEIRADRGDGLKIDAIAETA